ncbi:MAG: hypothetical protein J7K59_07365 [Candidatus Korarchaeota archaeon]|nr:hypothetical protein [Candidatus Korarchaeota archaeon]
MIIRSVRFHIATTLKTLQFPLYYPLILDSLKKRNFEITAMPPPAQPFGVRIYLGGRIAHKGECSVILNPDKKIIACEGLSVSNTVKCFHELLEICRDDFNIGDQEFDYYEILSRYIVKPEKNPLKMIGDKDWGDLYNRVSNILGVKLHPYVISFVVAGRSPRDKKWLDIRIYPDPALPDMLGVEVIYREENMAKVISFVEKLEENILKIINVLEE